MSVVPERVDQFPLGHFRASLDADLASPIEQFVLRTLVVVLVPSASLADLGATFACRLVRDARPVRPRPRPGSRPQTHDRRTTEPLEQPQHPRFALNRQATPTTQLRRDP